MKKRLQALWLSKRAQTEMVGLLFIVILISLGVVFFLTFIVFSPQDQSSEEIQVQQTALLTNKAILDVTTPCRGLDVAELIRDCATYKQVSCPALASGASPPTKKSCEYLKEDILPKFFEATLEKSGIKYKYRVIIDDSGGSPVEKLKIDKSPAKFSSYTPQILYLPSPYGAISVELGIYS